MAIRIKRSKPPTKKEKIQKLQVKERLRLIYGDVGANWFALPSSLLNLTGYLIREGELSYQEVYFLMVLLKIQYANSCEPPTVGYDRLSEYLGVNERRIRDIILGLEKKGVIERVHSRLGMKHRANCYKLDKFFTLLQKFYPHWRQSEKERRERRY